MQGAVKHTAVNLLAQATAVLYAPITPTHRPLSWLGKVNCKAITISYRTTEQFFYEVVYSNIFSSCCIHDSEEFDFRNCL